MTQARIKDGDWLKGHPLSFSTDLEFPNSGSKAGFSPCAGWKMFALGDGIPGLERRHYWIGEDGTREDQIQVRLGSVAAAHAVSKNPLLVWQIYMDCLDLCQLNNWYRSE